MCGVAAIIRSNPGDWPDLDHERMGRAMARLAPRGPDGQGVRSVAGGRALLGHRRLAIQDLSHEAAQPMATADGSLTLVYNGELYNAAELREALKSAGRTFRSRSDTEVLLHALDAWGLRRTLDKLVGMFAFMAVSEKHGHTRVIGAVDPAGMKPLVYHLASGDASRPATLTCASSCDALRELLPSRPAIDPIGLRHVLSVGYCPAPLTVWRDIRKLPPGSFLEWELGTAEPTVSSYWRPPAETRPASGDDRERFALLLGRISREHLVGDVPVGMFLSAGLDSSSIALALGMNGANLSSITAHTLTTSAPTDEGQDAARLAARLGLSHRLVPFGPAEVVPMLRAAAERFDEPQGYTALLTATRIADALRAASPATRVVLSGDGGDEAFGGYAWHRDTTDHPLNLAAFTAPLTPDEEAHRDLAARVAAPGASARERIAALHALGKLSYVHRYLVRTFGGFHPAEAEALLPDLACGYDEGAFAGWLQPMDEPSLPHPRRAQRLDLLGFCAGSIQPKLDRACMAVGLELRAPYLDHRMLEWGLALPVQAGEAARGAGKPLIRALLMRGVERGLIPREILSRPKQGFSLKLAEEGFDGLDDLINGSRLVRDGLLRPDWPSYVMGDADSHRVRRFTIAMIAAWYDARA